ncbi:uncharacterized protein [Nicotiana sylvestris]|uniref:uncharacterized protein n=1 Tax=Nicotiana sylvestris TaxID=4096 RepID=UPI00388C6E3D
MVEGMPFTLDHLIRLYSPRIYRGGLVKLRHRSTKAVFASIDEDKDRGWMSRFIHVRTSDLIPAKKMPFLEEWNMRRLGEAISMTPPSSGEEETQRPTKDRKRKKETLTESPKPKRAKARKPRANATILTPEAAESLRAEDDDDCPLVHRARRGADASKVAGQKTAELEMDDVVPPRIEETLEEGQIRDAQNRETPDVGASQREDNAFGDFFAGVEEDADLNAPVVLEKAVIMLYDQAFSKLRAELTHCEEEFEKCDSESKELKTLYARREEELNSLRASSEKMLQERAKFIEQHLQIKRKDTLTEQLREEIVAKDIEILELKRYKDSMASERDTLRGELASTQSLIQGAKEEAHKLKVFHAESTVALSAAKSEVDALIFSYRGRCCCNEYSSQFWCRIILKLSPEFSSSLSCFEGIMATVPKSAHQKEGSPTSASRRAMIPWMPNEVPDLVDWARKLDASSTYDERKWRDLSKGKWEAKHHGIGEFSEVRPSPFEEEERPSISETRKDNKRKRSSKDEDSHSKAGPARGCEEDVAADKDLIFIGCSVDINAPGEDDSTLMTRPRRPPETVEPTGLEAPSLKGEIPHRGGAKAFDKLKSELLRCEDKLRKALNGEKSLRLLCDKKTRELIHLRSELNRSHDYEGNLEKQVTSILREYKFLLPSLETKVSVSQLQRKTEILECLRGEANQVNSECNELKAQINTHVAAKRNALAKASTLEIQLLNAREGNLV